MAKRGGVGLVGVYAAAGAGWLALAWGVVRPWIGGVHRGEVGSAIGRMLRERMHRPLGHYLGLWDDLAWAVAGAMGCHLGLMLAVRGWGRRDRWGFGVFAGAFLGLTVVSGARHDYVAYLEIWELVRRGGDPWEVSARFGYPLNAYGPLFNGLAIFAGWNGLGPKLLFATAYLGYAADVWRRGWAGGGLWMAGLCGPFFWVEVAYFGHFDVLVAILCVVATREAIRREEWRAGTALAAGVLLKYVPICLVPFVAMRGREVRWRVVGASVAVVGLGMVGAWWWWGEGVWRPFGVAAGRGSTFASIFRYLKGEWSPMRWVVAAPDVDRWSLPAMAGALAAVWGLAVWGRVERGAGVVMGALAALAFYKVGFLQYHAVALLLLVDWGVGRGDVGRGMWWWGTCAFGWYAALDVVYAGAGGVLHPGDRMAWLDEVVGLPTFVLDVGLIGALMWANWRGR